MANADILQAPRREILSDHVYSQLKGLIMSGHVPPGDKLNIEDLSRRLKVSPTPVREALARLESEGLTTKLALRGYTTTHLLSDGEIRDLYDLRLMLEVPSAGRAATRIDLDGMAALSRELDSAARPPAEEDDYESYRALIDHDARFHDLILSIAGNDMVTRAFDRTHCHLHIFRLTYRGRFGEQTVAEHRTLVEALVRQDPHAAEAAMRAHLTRARDRVLADIANPAAGDPPAPHPSPTDRQPLT